MHIVMSDKVAKSHKHKSAVWEFFDKPIEEEDNEKASKNKKIPCKMYYVQLTDGGGTSNLMNHLQA